MEEKKTPQADLDQQRTTGFLLGLVLVLAMLFVALEWNKGGVGRRRVDTRLGRAGA